MRVMAVSRRSALSIVGIAASAGAFALLMTAAMAGGAPPMASSAAVAPALTGSCSATAHVDAQWSGNQVVTITIANTSTSAATTWNATWTLVAGQRIVSAWNATVTTTGGTATAVNAPYNGALGPGASTTFGMQLAGPASIPAPSCANDAAGTPGTDVTVTQSDNGRTLTLYVGQTLEVSLGAEYLTPRVSGPALTQVSASGGYPTGQPLTARYRAAAPGPVDLTTQSDHACLHDPRPCAMPIMLWRVHVDVVELPSTGQTVTLTQADNTRSVSLHVGDLLVVNLPSMYQPPKLSTPGALVQRDVTGGYPTGQSLVARYTAAAPGRTDLSTITDNACLHQPTPCPSPRVPWTVHVTVTA
jgi:hypothetical protein